MSESNIDQSSSLNCDDDQSISSYAQSFVDANAENQNTMNKPDGSLPFGYLNPATEGKVFWMCSRDQTGRITSVFQCDDEEMVGDSGMNRDIKHLSNEAEARKYRDELIQAGWIQMKDPGQRFFYGGREVEMTRQMKRQLAKKVKKMNKQMGI